MLARELEPLARDDLAVHRQAAAEGGAVRRAASSWPRSSSASGRRNGMLRHPSYKGLRDDKPAEQVVLETAQEPPPPEPRAQGAARTNVDKVLFPATGFTKGELIAYYERMGEVILPHLHGRLVAVKRYPNGVDGKKWWERDHRIDDLPTLLEFANKAAIELHPLLAAADAPERPTFARVRPRPRAAGRTSSCAARSRSRCAGCSPSSGSRASSRRPAARGSRSTSPLNTRRDYDETKPFAKAVAETMEKGMPEQVVSRQAKKLREGKVLVDWGQNDRDASRWSAPTRCAARSGRRSRCRSRGRSSRTRLRSRFEWKRRARARRARRRPVRAGADAQAAAAGG